MTAIGKHPFSPDDTATTWDGKPGCRRCPLPERHDIHDMPAVADEVREETARRVGERGGT